jgi:hypothetical protein
VLGTATQFDDILVAVMRHMRDGKARLGVIFSPRHDRHGSVKAWCIHSQCVVMFDHIELLVARRLKDCRRPRAKLTSSARAQQDLGGGGESDSKND